MCMSRVGDALPPLEGGESPPAARAAWQDVLAARAKVAEELAARTASHEVALSAVDALRRAGVDLTPAAHVQQARAGESSGCG